MADKSSSILIVGTGAMACLFAARLRAVGIRVSMLGSWPEALAALRGDGVRLVEQDGSEKAYPVQVIDNPDQCEEFTAALVLVKAWQTERAAGQLVRCLAYDGLALTLQNGMGNRETLAQVLGPGRVFLGSATTGAHLLEPGKVKAAGEGVLSLESAPRLDELRDQFQVSGFTVQAASDMTGLVWGKLVINSAINPLTAILKVPNGALLENPPARELLRAAARESAGIAALLGISLPYPDPAAAAEQVARRTAHNRSSMFQDILRGAPTEIDAISGAVVREAEKCGATAPINQTLWHLVKSIGNL